MDLKGSEIVRILPRRNDLTNQDWITDKTRYSFDGLKNQRFSYPMVYTKTDSSFKISTWDSFYSSFNFNYLSTLSSISSGRIELGGGLDLYTIYLSDLFGRSLSSLSTSTSVNLNDFRSSYLSSNLSVIEQSNLILISGLNLPCSFPLLNVRINQKVNSKHPSKVIYFGLSHKCSYEVVHLGLSLPSNLSFLRGKNLSSFLCNSSMNVELFASSNFLTSSIDQLSRFHKIHSNVLLSDTTSIGLSELGFDRVTQDVTNSFYYGLNTSNTIFMPKSSFCVFHSTHSNISLSRIQSYDSLSTVWYLPSFSPFESELPYMNLLGLVQWTRKCSSSFGDSSTYEDVLRRLISSISNRVSFTVSLDSFFGKVPGIMISGLPTMSHISSFKESMIYSPSYSTASVVPFVSFSQVNTL